MKQSERIERMKALNELALALEKKIEIAPKKEDVVQYNEVVQELTKLKRIEEGFRDIMTFAKTYFTGLPPHDLLKPNCPSPPFHYELAKHLREAVLSPRANKTVISAPRSHAKSTIVTNIFPIWCICYVDDVNERYWAIIGASQKNAKDFLDVIKSELEDNELLRNDFGDLKGPVWNQLEIVTSNRVKISAHGAGEALRGMRFGSERPSIILDDIETDDSVRTPEQIAKLADWLDRTVLPLGDPMKSKVFFVGTILHYNSVLNQIIRDRPDWTCFKYRAIEKWPDRMDLWREWEDIYHSRDEGSTPEEAARIARKKAMDFYQRHREEMHKGAKVLWPERLDLLSLMEIRAAKRMAFNSEYQNEPIDEATRIFSKIHYYEPDEVNLEELEIIGGCDPSMGKSRRSDPSVIMTVGRHRKTGILYVLDVDNKKRHPDQIIRDVFKKHEAFRYSWFSVETVAFQQFFKDEMQKRAAEMGVYLPIREYKPSARITKEHRIEAMEPMISNGYVRFLRTQRDLIEQLEYYPKGAHDDCLDVLAQILEQTKRRAGLVYTHFKF